MIEAKDTKEAPMWLELCYRCPECNEKRSMSINTYRLKKAKCPCIIDVCPTCDEIFEVIDKI